METDQKYIVETFIEADVTCADGSKACRVFSSGVTGVNAKVGAEELLDLAKKAVRDNDRRGWLESYLRYSSAWNMKDIHGAQAKYLVRAKVHVRLAGGVRTVGECKFERDRMALSE